MSNLMKIHPGGSELLHADGQTDEHEGNKRLLPFCEDAYKRYKLCQFYTAHWTSTNKNEGKNKNDS